jgi:hypothetical protein
METMAQIVKEIRGAMIQMAVGKMAVMLQIAILIQETML